MRSFLTCLEVFEQFFKIFLVFCRFFPPDREETRAWKTPSLLYISQTVYRAHLLFNEYLLEK